MLALALFGGVIAVLPGCSGSLSGAGGANGAASSGAFLSQVTLEIPTISCSGCWPRIEASARNVSGVKEVKFDEERIQRVIIVYDSSQMSPEAIVAAIEKRGDKVTSMTEVTEP
ncbi:MAG: heavy-metal-associated domain-containing protein [Chloroflexi bacterium]|nr:heavy-metal-associated domain-containing protein [Chloroflexota bacterium]